MPNLVADLLPALYARRLPGLDAGPQAVYPAYAGSSLANLPSSICHWLGAPPFGIGPLQAEILAAFPGPYRHVILVVVDGLGLERLERFRRQGPPFGLWQDLGEEGLLAPLTSIAPSTTCAALTSLWTGRTPAEHGVIGYEMYLKEYQMNANMILHAPASFQGDLGSLRRANFDPLTFLPVATLGPHLAANGIRATSYNHHSIARSGLSDMLSPQVNRVAFRTLADLWVSLLGELADHAAERTYSYVYWSELDELMHRFGPNDRRVDLEFSSFTLFLEYFIQEMGRWGQADTLFLVTADHGHLDTPINPNFELKNHPQLDSALQILPSGEARLAYLFARPGKLEAIQAYAAGPLAGQFALLDSAQAAASGLLGGGQHHPRLAERMGDFILAAQGKAYLFWANKENLLVGRHGGLSATEMLIPLLGKVI